MFTLGHWVYSNKLNIKQNVFNVILYTYEKPTNIILLNRLKLNFKCLKKQLNMWILVLNFQAF